MRNRIVWTVSGLLLAALLVVGVVVGIKVLSSKTSPGATSECTVPLTSPASVLPVTVKNTAGAAGSIAVTPTPVYLTAVQLQHASTINAVGMARGLPQRARIIAIATAFQESGLRNLPGGDRDSVGLFQQRPSQGWGTVAQIKDPVYAAGKFYDALLEVSGWQRMTLTSAAQAVQFSAFPDAYAKWEGQAATLAAALGGDAPLQLGCVAGAVGPTADAPDRRSPAGLSAASAPLVAAVSAAQAELGGLKVLSAKGGTAVLTVAIPGIPADQAGRALAAWAVAHGAGFSVSAVAVDAQSWTDHAWTTGATVLPAGRVAITTG